MIEALNNIYFGVTAIYLLCILLCWIGWRKTPLQTLIKYNPSTAVSIIVPARNEEQNILNCLEDLAEQDYPAALYEVIVVDDASSDNTAMLISEFLDLNTEKTFRLIQLQQDNKLQLFKKRAISTGIEEARGQLILTTDADCRFSPRWISSVVQQYEITNASLIAGPVCFRDEQSIFGKIQTLEFMGLIGIAVGSIRNRLYMMCNGANLAYSKKVFHDVGGFQSENNTASGDDTQLMLKIADTETEKIIFLKSKAAVVFTSARSSLTDLIQQRKRWASKIPGHSSLFTLIIAISAYLLHAGIIASAIYMAAKGQFISVLALPFLFKCIIEFIFLLDVSAFFDRQKLLWLFLPAQIIYPFYIVIIGAIAPFGTYMWKERRVK